MSDRWQRSNAISAPVPNAVPKPRRLSGESVPVTADEVLRKEREDQQEDHREDRAFEDPNTEADHFRTVLTGLVGGGLILDF